MTGFIEPIIILSTFYGLGLIFFQIMFFFRNYSTFFEAEGEDWILKQVCLFPGKNSLTIFFVGQPLITTFNILMTATFLRKI
jgi:hypothetical protein